MKNTQKASQQYMTKTLQELDDVAKLLLSTIEKSAKKNGATVVALEGNLGAGKTTLVQSLAKHLGVTEPVSSPTFVITKYYDLNSKARPWNWQRLIHIDAYRLEGFSTEPLDLPTMFSDPSNIIFLEWPSIIKDDLPKQYIQISIETTNSDTRLVHIEPSSEPRS